MKSGKRKKIDKVIDNKTKAILNGSLSYTPKFMSPSFLNKITSLLNVKFILNAACRFNLVKLPISKCIFTKMLFWIFFHTIPFLFQNLMIVHFFMVSKEHYHCYIIK